MLNIFIGLLVFYVTILFPSTLSYSNIDFLPIESQIIGKDEVYIVKRGDSINKISNLYNIPTEQIIKRNKLGNNKTLKAGQRINVSSKTIIPKRIENGLIINLPEYKIFSFRNGQLHDTYKITIGKQTWETPRGKFKIANKSINPTWQIPPGMTKRLNIKKKYVPPGPNNPLGKYWMGLSLPHIGIHSTNKPSSIGKAKSHGCMRLKPNDAENLYSYLDIGTYGEIIYEPVKVAYNSGDIYLEVHKDVYNLYPNLYSRAMYLIRENHYENHINSTAVKYAVDSKSGIPVKINQGYNTPSSPNQNKSYQYSSKTKVKSESTYFTNSKIKKNKHTQKKSTQLWGSTYEYKN